MLSVAGAPQLVNSQVFLLFLRNPVQPEPDIALMPIIPPEKISSEQVKQLYDYIINVADRPKRALNP